MVRSSMLTDTAMSIRNSLEKPIREEILLTENETNETINNYNSQLKIMLTHTLDNKYKHRKH